MGLQSGGPEEGAPRRIGRGWEQKKAWGPTATGSFFAYFD